MEQQAQAMVEFAVGRQKEASKEEQSDFLASSTREISKLKREKEILKSRQRNLVALVEASKRELESFSFVFGDIEKVSGIEQIKFADIEFGESLGTVGVCFLLPTKLKEKKKRLKIALKNIAGCFW